MNSVTLPVDPLAGAVVAAKLWLCSSQSRRFRSAGLPVPDPIPVRLLIDTGANATLIDEEVLKRLSLPPVDRVSVGSDINGVAGEVRNRYECCLWLEGSRGPSVFSGLFVGAPPLRAGIDGVLGIDILLSGFSFTFDGPSRTFTLSFPAPAPKG